MVILKWGILIELHCRMPAWREELLPWRAIWKTKIPFSEGFILSWEAAWCQRVNYSYLLVNRLFYGKQLNSSPWNLAWLVGQFAVDPGSIHSLRTCPKQVSCYKMSESSFMFHFKRVFFFLFWKSIKIVFFYFN